MHVKSHGHMHVQMKTKPHHHMPSTHPTSAQNITSHINGPSLPRSPSPSPYTRLQLALPPHAPLDLRASRRNP